MSEIVSQSVDNDLRGYGKIKTDYDSLNGQIADIMHNKINVLDYVTGNANYLNSGNHKWYADSSYTTLSTDDTTALQNAINATPSGGILLIPVSCMISSQLVISKPITIIGNFNFDKSTNQIYGSKIVISDLANQSSMESAILINASSVKIFGIGLKGRGASSGSVGILCKTSNGSKLEVYVEGFDKGVKMGVGSAHVSMHKSKVTGNNDAIFFGNGNLFDFYFEDCLLEGNVVSSANLEINTSVENVTFQRCHMGFQQYGILQDPTTTTGDGYSALHLIDTPIEQVSVQHMNIVNGGNIRVEGGYWTWTSSPQAISALVVKNLSNGGLWFSPKLEATYPNASSPSVISITGYTNYNIYLFGSLNSFAQKWANYGGDTTPLPLKRVFLEGKAFANQEQRTEKITVSSANTDTTVLAWTPIVNNAYAVNIWVQVNTACTVTVNMIYNDGNGLKTKVLLSNASLTVDDYCYSWFGYMETFNQAKITVNASVANAVITGACAIPH